MPADPIHGITQIGENNTSVVSLLTAQNVLLGAAALAILMLCLYYEREFKRLRRWIRRRFTKPR